MMHRRRLIKNNRHQLFNMEKMNAADLATLRVCLPVLGVKGDVDEFIKKKLEDGKIKLNSYWQVTYLHLS